MASEPTIQPGFPVEPPLVDDVTSNEIFLPITASQTVNLWASGQLPVPLRTTTGYAPHVNLVDNPPGDITDPTLVLDFGSEQVVSRWVYALVTPFAGISKPGAESITYIDLLQHWQGQGTGPFTGQPLLVSQETLDALVHILGGPRPESVQVLPAEALLEEAWVRQTIVTGQPVLAIVPFEALEPRWRVLPLDGQSPIHNNFDVVAYPLVVPISLYGNPGILARVIAENTPDADPPFVVRSNRDANRLTVLAVTGVTALVRSTAKTMENQGITYPAIDIGSILWDADITHISNEVPFAENCPDPDPYDTSMIFCSKDSYIGLMESVGTDVVELTGDHFHDWGAEAMLHTLDLYNERGWGYYGGGFNVADGQKPLLMMHNGNKLAFLGCNGKGTRFARATDTKPGSVPCDFEKMTAEIGRLRAEGYLVIFTFQHMETYDYTFTENLKDDFQLVAGAGAVVVSGSQAHQPHEMEFYGDAFIHYGLGNLFFDQYLISEATRQGFIDRHVFYDGRYVGLELIPIYLIDFARPRLMTDAESRSLLGLLFRLSDFIP